MPAACGLASIRAAAGALVAGVMRLPLVASTLSRCRDVPTAVLALDFLYCQPCGEVFIGGFKQSKEGEDNVFYLSPDYPHLDQIPDRSASLRRLYEDYAVFWPAGGRPLFRTNGPNRWTWQQENLSGYQWAAANFFTKPAESDGLLVRLRPARL